MAGHIIMAVLVPFIIYMSAPGSTLFSYHPTLLTIAFLCLVPQAVWMLDPRTSLVSLLVSARQPARLSAHITLHVAALLLAVIGVRCVYQHKENKAAPHYTSWHSYAGIATVLYMMLQCVAGTILYVARATPPRWMCTRGRDMKLYHATSGALLHCVSTVTVVLGMWSTWYWTLVTHWVGVTGWWVGAVSAGLLLLVTLQQVTDRYQPVTHTTTTRTTPPRRHS